jgi:hypothetical protein
VDFETVRQTAYDWHGGGGSPLYAWASCGGKFGPFSPEETLNEILDDLEWARVNDPDEVVRLSDLATYISHHCTE